MPHPGRRLARGDTLLSLWELRQRVRGCFPHLRLVPVVLGGRPETSACSSSGEPTTSKPWRPRMFRPGSVARLRDLAPARRPRTPHRPRAGEPAKRMGSVPSLARLTARRTYGGSPFGSIGRTAYVTRPEGAEGALAAPKRLVALTTTCTVFPTSAGVTA